jgi:hypothetical protein
VRHQGGGHKRSYRCIDFVRPEGITSRIERIEYDPNRSARIALVKHLGQEWDGAVSHSVSERECFCMQSTLDKANLLIAKVATQRSVSAWFTSNP